MVLKKYFPRKTLLNRFIDMISEVLDRMCCIMFIWCAFVGICVMKYKVFWISLLAIFVLCLVLHIIHDIYGRIKCLLSKNPKIRKLAKKL